MHSSVIFNTDTIVNNRKAVYVKATLPSDLRIYERVEFFFPKNSPLPCCHEVILVCFRVATFRQFPFEKTEHDIKYHIAIIAIYYISCLHYKVLQTRTPLDSLPVINSRASSGMFPAITAFFNVVCL